jgi:GntR family transcriptional regulator, transcriptional repressor for pyruvate dehydrogenase complex
MAPDPTTLPSGRSEAVRGDTSERIAHEIRLYLETNDLQPGDRIGTEKELAREFGVSRPTLREAVRLLTGTHLIRVTQGRTGGIFVAGTVNDSIGHSVSASVAAMLETDNVTLCQLLEARMLLEVPLAGLAAQRADDAIVAQLEAAIEDARGHDPADDDFRLADARFHEIVAHAAGNDLLVAFTRWSLEVLQPSLIAHIGSLIDGELILRQHEEILRAIRRGQAAAARRAMERHIAHIQDRLAERDRQTGVTPPQRRRP